MKKIGTILLIIVAIALCAEFGLNESDKMARASKAAQDAGSEDPLAKINAETLELEKQLAILKKDHKGLEKILKKESAIESERVNKQIRDESFIQSQKQGAVNRRNRLIVEAFALIIGVILFAAGNIQNRTTIVAEPATTETGKKCPFCAEIVKEDAIVCRYCGKDFPIATTSEA